MSSPRPTWQSWFAGPTKGPPLAVEPLGKEPIDLGGCVRWAAAGEKFFTIAAVPTRRLPRRNAVRCARALDPLTGEVFFP